MSNNFLDKDGLVVGPMDFNLTLGRKAAALCRSHVLSTEDLAAVNAIATAIAGNLTVTATQSGTWNIGTVTNLSQFGGAAINLGAGAVGTGTLRITQASDSPLVTAMGNSSSAVVANGAAGDIAGYLRTIKDASTSTADSPINLNTVAGTAIATGNGVTGAGSMRVTIANNNSPVPIINTMPANQTTGDTGAKTVTGNGATQTNPGYKGVQIILNLGAVSGTTPTLVLSLQGSVDGGTTWYTVPGTSAVTASLVASGTFGILIYPGATNSAGSTTSGVTSSASTTIPPTWRVVWTIGGTTPSFTITNIQYNYLV